MNNKTMSGAGMRTECAKRRQTFALAQGLLPEREEERARAHLGTCEDCKNIFESYRALDSVLDEWAPGAEPSPWFDARLAAALDAAPRASAWRGFLGLGWREAAMAPALAVLLLIAGIATFRHRHPKNALKGSNAVTALAPSGQIAKSASAPFDTATQELRMYQNLPMLEDYDMLADFDVISELPKGSGKIAD